MLETGVCGDGLLCNHHNPHFLLFTANIVSNSSVTHSTKNPQSKNSDLIISCAVFIVVEKQKTQRSLNLSLFFP